MRFGSTHEAAPALERTRDELLAAALFAELLGLAQPVCTRRD
jgi:hypothetical protein